MHKALMIAAAGLVLAGGTSALSSSKTIVHAGAPVFGPLDFQRLATTGLDFSIPPAGVQPKMTEEQISAIAKQSPEYAQASAVRFQFLYLTTLVNAISPATVRSDPELASDLQHVGHPVDLPVWVVSFEGLTLPASYGTDVNHEDNEIVDAYSGALVLSFTYR